MKKLLSALITTLIAVAMLFSLAACNKNDTTGDDSETTQEGGSETQQNTNNDAALPLINDSMAGGNLGEVKLEEGDTYAVINIRDFGEITLKLFPESAPKAVENFTKLAESGYYTGKTFHRVYAGFMMQGGSPNGDGLSDAEYETFGVEPSLNARHFYGALAMANSGGKNAQQFYVVNKNTPEDPTGNGERRFYESLTDEIIAKYNEVGGYAGLDGGYTVFGQTVDGFDVIDAIAEVETQLVNPANPESEKTVPLETIFIDSVTVDTY